jgi:hypothetical protein
MGLLLVELVFKSQEIIFIYGAFMKAIAICNVVGGM